MKEIINVRQASSDDLSKKISERIKRESGALKNKKDEKISAEEVESGALELAALLEEKEDLLRALNLGGKNKEEKTEKIPKMKDMLDADFNDIDFNSLNRLFSKEDVFEEAKLENTEELEKIKLKIAKLASQPKIMKAYEEMLGDKIEIIRQARKAEKAKSFNSKLSLSKFKLLAHRNNEDVKLTIADKRLLENYEKILEKNKAGINGLMSVPEVFLEAGRRELLQYRKELLKGGFVETENKKEEIAEILAHLDLGIPVFLRGHLGAGKTEDARHIARKYYGVEPEFISGSEEATIFDFYGKTQIGIRSEEDRVREYKLRVDEFKENFPEADEKEIRNKEKEYYDSIVVKGQTSSFFQYGPLVRAMKEGKPIIIDEIDAIPHSIVIRLNDILTRRAGDKVKIQENGGEEIEVQKGFCVIATGNIKGAKYKREDLDAAFLSRWWSTEIKYLPADQTMKILIASLIDTRGSLEINSQEDFEALQKLVDSAGEIQKIFTGEKVDLAGEGADAGIGRGGNLEKSVLSMRDIWNIVKPWKAGGFSKPLESYVHSEFIKKATVQRDAIYLVQLFSRFGFFKDWQAEDFGIAGLDKRKLEAFQGKK